MAIVTFPPFEPDKNRFNGDAMPSMRNVMPVSDGWAPLPSPNPAVPLLGFLTDEDGNPLSPDDGEFLVSGSEGEVLDGAVLLPGPCVGAYFARTDSGVARAFFGTDAAIYEYDFADYLFADVSGPSAPYSTNGRWSFEKFGNNLYAQNGVDPEQVIDLNIGTAFADNATAPRASYIRAVGDFLVRARLTDEPSVLQWSALNDPASNEPGLYGSDQQYFPEGNGITGLVPMSFGAVVFCRDAIYQMNFALTSEFVFTFNPITKFRGAIAPHAICSIGQDDYVFYGNDGFFRGVGMAPIGAERVNRWFLANTEEAARVAMTAAADYRRNTVWFRYRDISGEFKALGYQWQLDRWVPPSDMDFSEMLRAETPPVTIDGLSDIYASIDDIDVTFDSSSLDGGASEFAGITSDGYFAFMNGAAMAATLSTNELSLNGTNNASVKGGRLLGDALNVAVTVSTAEFGGGPARTRAAVRPTVRTRSLGLLADGRTHKFKAEVEAGEEWTTINGLEVDVFGTGKS